MKISEEYQNFLPALMFVIGDKNPYPVSNDKTKLAYQIPLRNFKRGFDFYELNKAKDGSVFFTLFTIVGFKTICQTNSNYHYRDMSVTDWQKEIFDIGFEHFYKEEYVALKKGYIKTGRTKYQEDKSKIIKRRNEDLKTEQFDVEELSKTEKFLKSSDEFLKLSLEQQQKKNSGCLVVLLFVLVLITTLS